MSPVKKQQELQASQCANLNGNNTNNNGNSSACQLKLQALNNQNKSDNQLDYNHKTTVSLHQGQSPEQWAHQPIIPPIYLTTNYAQPTPGVSDYEYSRSSNPTRNVLEQMLAALESADYGLAFSSGLGALTTVSFLLESGDHVLCCDDVYGGAHRFFAKCAPRMGITTTFVDGTTVESWIDKFVLNKTKLIWIESPTNPMMKIMNIREIVVEVKKLNPDCIIVVDNTFMTPVFQNPLKLGADIVMHSCTKYINGHSDVIMGALMTSNKGLYERLKFNQNALGIIPSAFDCFLTIRSIKTLQVRVRQQSSTAMHVARFLETHQHVDRVLYPGLESHPQHEIAKREFSGFGGMISFALKKTNLKSTNKDVNREGIEVVNRVKVFHCAVSLGCVASLIQIPSLMTHSAVAEDHRLGLGMDDRFLRISVGLEDAQDLICDLDQALNSAYEYLATSSELDEKATIVCGKDE